MITILLVDDEQTDRELMRHILQPEGHHVLEASNYSQAIEVFEQHSRQIDLLVADVALPERNGCELAKYLLKLEPELRVLFVSGFTGAEICKQYLTKGRLVYIEGRLQTRQWQDQQGQKRYSTEVIASNMQMLGGRGGERTGGVDEGLGAQEQNGDMAEITGGFPPDDDIPF